MTGTDVQVRARGARPGRLPSVEVIPSQSGVVATANPAVQNITVLPMTVNLFIYQGDDFFLDMAVADSLGNPINVMNMQPLSHIRTAPNAMDLLAEFQITVGPTPTNLLHLHLRAADSNGLHGTVAWDIQLSYPTIVTLAAGQITLTPQVTL